MNVFGVNKTPNLGRELVHALLLASCLAIALTAVLAAPLAPAPSGDLSAVAPALAKLAPDMLVVVGRNAPVAEQRAAAQIAAALRLCGGPEDNLTDDVTAFHDLDLLIQHDLVLVGTYDDNDVLHQQWGHWAQDRARAAAEPSTPDSTPSGPWYPGAPATGFAVMGYGAFKSPDVGYIETDRNAFYLVPNLLHVSTGDPYRIRINITGAGSAGVVLAEQTFLATGCLCGVIPGPNVALPSAPAALALSGGMFGVQLPVWLPRQHMLGWIMADSTLYAGFLETSSRPASVIWVAKYNAADAIASFDDTPHRMSTRDELFLARTASPADARAALAGLEQTLSAAKTSCSHSIIGSHAVLKADDFIAGAAGPWVVMSTVPDPLGSDLVGDVLDNAR